MFHSNYTSILLLHCYKVIFIRPGIEIEHSDTKTIAEKAASEILDTCQQTAKASLQASSSSSNTSEILEQLAACVQDGIAQKIEVANEEIKFQTDIRTDMSDLLEEYTCYDDTMKTSEAKSTKNWKNRQVDVLLERPAAKIHYIHNFITAEECLAIQEEAEPDLKDATVADGEGGSEIDESRKAKQAGIEVDWEKEEAGDLIARLSRRVYDYTNHVLPMFEIEEAGQEDIMSIQYFGRGKEDEAPDRYRPQ